LSVKTLPLDFALDLGSLSVGPTQDVWAKKAMLKTLGNAVQNRVKNSLITHKPWAKAKCIPLMKDHDQ